VDWIQEIQYSSPVSPRGAKKAVWNKRDVAASSARLEIQPSTARHFHLGAAGAQAIRLDGFHPPEVHSVTNPDFLRIAPPAPQAHPPTKRSMKPRTRQAQFMQSQPVSPPNRVKV